MNSLDFQTGIDSLEAACDLIRKNGVQDAEPFVLLALALDSLNYSGQAEAIMDEANDREPNLKDKIQFYLAKITEANFSTAKQNVLLLAGVIGK